MVIRLRGESAVHAHAVAAAFDITVLVEDDHVVAGAAEDPVAEGRCRAPSADDDVVSAAALDLLAPVGTDDDLMRRGSDEVATGLIGHRDVGVNRVLFAGHAISESGTERA